MPHTYILRCVDGTFYVGSTVNLDARLWQHQNGEGAEYTKRRLPVQLEWCGEFERIEDAYALEKRIQGWSHAKRQTFIDGGFEAVRALNRSRRR